MNRTYTCNSGTFSKKDKSKLITWEDGHQWKIKKVINVTTVKVNRYVPWVKWFWKIKVPRWMMYKITLSVKNRWGKFDGAHHFDITILNFGFTINFYPPGPKPYGVHYGHWSPEQVKQINEMPRATVPYNKIKES